MRRAAVAALALLMAAGAIVEGSPARKDKETLVKAVVRPARVRQGQTFTVEIRARRLRDAGAVAFHLLFDPDLVEPVPSGFSEGPVMGRGGAGTSFLAAPASTGDRIILGLARLGRSAGTQGKGLLCRLTFRAVGDGPAAFAFDQARLTAPDASPLPARFVPGRVQVIPTRPERKVAP